MSAPPRHRIGVMAIVAVLTLQVGPPAASGQVDAKRAEAAALADRLSAQAREIVALDVSLRQAQDQLRDAEAVVRQTENDIAAATRRQDELKQSLVVQAQDAYVVGGSVSVLRYLVATNPGDDIARRAYLRVVSGLDRKLIGDLRAVRDDLEALRDRAGVAQRRAQARAEAIEADRSALDKAVRGQRALLAQLNGEIATLVAAEQARRDAETAQRAAATAPTAAGPAPADTAVSGGPEDETWACIRQLESGNNYASPGGGAYQFLDSTWQSLGYTGTASDYPPDVQDAAARQLQERSGWSQWTVAPLCGRPD
ncbi:MAG: transglycosylase family protein [Actinomycetota bacterium]